MNAIDYPQRLREIAEELAMEDSEVDTSVVLGAADLIDRLMSLATCDCSHCVICGATKTVEKEASSG